ncbi:MAG: Re/Si-specific NAD(P)(+) transhydrogenase subunit alpha [Bacteroidota bacterium]
MAVTIGVPRETARGEHRVALTPDVAARLAKAGYTVAVERGAGARAHFQDADYETVGARTVGRDEALGADLVATVRPPEDDLGALRSGAVLIGFLQPLDRPERAARLAERGVTAFSMELVPRITRAQKMDALSAMSTVAGYKAVLLAADTLPKFFPLLTTAAGTIRPAQVLVLGAGVTGLQALATARRLGAVTSGYDVRPAAREQVESVGATFVELDLDTGDAEDRGGYAKALAEDQQAQQVERLARYVAKADIVISTALIPGRPAPVLITEAGVEGMQPGSVIVDLAAPNGGNCAATQPDERVVHAGVHVLGPMNLPASMPLHASQMYARTLAALVTEFTEDGAFAPDFDDEIAQGACVTRDGAVVHERVKPLTDSLNG